MALLSGGFSSPILAFPLPPIFVVYYFNFAIYHIHSDKLFLSVSFYSAMIFTRAMAFEISEEVPLCLHPSSVKSMIMDRREMTPWHQFPTSLCLESGPESWRGIPRCAVLMQAGRHPPSDFFCKYSIVSQLNLRTCIGKNHRTITFVQRSAFLAEKDSPRFPPSLYKHNSISMPNMCFYCFHIIFCTYEQNREASIAMTRDIQTTISFFRCLLCLPHVFEIITGQLAKRTQFISTHFFVPS